MLSPNVKSLSKIDTTWTFRLFPSTLYICLLDRCAGIPATIRHKFKPDGAIIRQSASYKIHLVLADVYRNRTWIRTAAAIPINTTYGSHVESTWYLRFLAAWRSESDACALLRDTRPCIVAFLLWRSENNRRHVTAVDVVMVCRRTPKYIVTYKGIGK